MNTKLIPVYERVKYLIEYFDMSKSDFASKMNITPQALSNVLSGENNPGFNFIYNLAIAFPNINMRWLITGEGEIFSNFKNLVEEPVIEYENIYDKLKSEIDSLKIRIRMIELKINK